MGILKKIFRTSKNASWEKLSTELGGTFTASTFYEKQKVEIQQDEWTITLDTYLDPRGAHGGQTYTRMRAPYINKDEFNFKIYKSSIFSYLGTRLGLQDVKTGHDHFDKHFIVKSNNEKKICALLSNDRIRELIEAFPDIHFEVKEDEGLFGAQFPDGVHELYFETAHEIVDLNRLKELFELFSEVLNQLCHIDGAYEDDPSASSC